MPGQEYKARGRSVKKMTSRGLTEENLKEGTVTDISARKESLPLLAEKDHIEEGKDTVHSPPERPGKRKQRYGNVRESQLRSGNVSQEPTRGSVPFSVGGGKENAPGKKTGSASPQDKPDIAAKDKDPRLRQKRLFTKDGDAPDKSDAAGRESRQGISFESQTGRDPDRISQYERIPEESIEDHKAEISRKQKRKLLYEKKGKPGRLILSEPHRHNLSGMPLTGRQIRTAEKVSEGLTGDVRDEDDPAVDSLHAGESLADHAEQKLKKAQARSNRTSGRRMRKGYREEKPLKGNRLRFDEPEAPGASKYEEIRAGKADMAEESRRKRAAKKLQKKRYSREYRKAGKAAAGGGTLTADGIAAESMTEKAKRVAKEIFARNQAVFITLGVTALIFILVSVSLFSCSASIQGAGSLIRITTYQSRDQDIYAAENAYRALENALDSQINHIETNHPGHEDYRYQVDEIGHNPYHLISYLSAKYGVWTYGDIRDELQQLFEQQYSLETDHEQVGSTTTRTVRVGESLGNVVTSGYCNCALCSGPWAGGPTASGVMPTADHTIAVDRHNPAVPMGTKVVMNGIEYTVEDTGSFAQYGVDFDVYYDEHNRAQAHGHQTWEAYIADDNGSEEVEVRVTNTRDTFSTSLTNSGFDAVARANLNEEELKIYEALNITLGNRDYLFGQENAYAGGGGMDYEIPPEALSDERAARMIREAQRYLGTPYTWGGSSPSGFDCSGFVSYVIDHCGNGWNFGRCTANELRSRCSYVPPDMARPGDLIFFQHTYGVSGASHVGIYIGNGMMIHCGKPVQYASINRDYWKNHFLSYGRLP